MEPVKQIVSKTVVIPNDDIDTDQIIPARFLTTTTKEGLGRNLFADWRYEKDGRDRKDFV
jgi:3-isopropylmalate/(R)-2-methylmalate dehydratase small subunit